MRLVSSIRRAVLPALALVSLCFLAACKSSSSSSESSASTITVSGTVTYTRIPLVTTADGVPTGLETDTSKFLSKPARGVLVRFYKSVQETAPDGTKSTVWKLATGADAVTDSSGKYSATVDKDTPIFVEVVSMLGVGPTPLVRLIADPLGMNSPLNQADRPLYLLRKGLDGSASDTNPTPATASASNATVDFSVGLDSKWWIGVPNPYLVGAAVKETTATGSRVLAILDTMYSFKSVFGLAGPSGLYPGTFDLHYRPGVNEPRGSYVEYDRLVFPQAYDSTEGARHYFGSLRGGPANDDAWDEGVICLMLGRNAQARSWSCALPPAAQNLTHLVPDLALSEGLAWGMAANILKTPYLADTSSAGTVVVDIRNRGGLAANEISPYSAPNLAALSWEMVLKGNSIASPGTPTTWANLNSSAMVRYFSPVAPKNADASKYVDVMSIYGQVKRLQDGQAAGEPVNLAGVFTDAVLTPLVAPYGLTWPRPTTGEQASWLLDWGTDPLTQTTPFAAIPLSMARAVKVGATYPNASELEVAYAQFYLSKDTSYDVSVTTQPAVLPAGVAVEIYFPSASTTFTFTGSGLHRKLSLSGNSTTPVLHFVRVRVLSPDQIAPDILATVQLVPATS